MTDCSNQLLYYSVAFVFDAIVLLINLFCITLIKKGTYMVSKTYKIAWYCWNFDLPIFVCYHAVTTVTLVHKTVLLIAAYIA